MRDENVSGINLAELKGLMEGAPDGFKLFQIIGGVPYIVIPQADNFGRPKEPTMSAISKSLLSDIKSGVQKGIDESKDILLFIESLEERYRNETETIE